MVLGNVRRLRRCYEAACARPVSLLAACWRAMSLRLAADAGGELGFTGRTGGHEGPSIHRIFMEGFCLRESGEGVAGGPGRRRLNSALYGGAGAPRWQRRSAVLTAADVVSTSARAAVGLRCDGAVAISGRCARHWRKRQSCLDEAFRRARDAPRTVWLSLSRTARRRGLHPSRAPGLSESVAGARHPLDGINPLSSFMQWSGALALVDCKRLSRHVGGRHPSHT
jgi:hypothetical protein